MKHLLHILLLLCLLCSCTNKEYRSMQGVVWGTEYHITYNADKPLDDSVISVMRQVELSLSMFDKQSTVSRINAGETDSVDAMFAKVFYIACGVYTQTYGAFDPTVANLVNLWGFGTNPSSGTYTPPSPNEIAEARRTVGLSKCYIRNNHLFCSVKGMKFDFSAIAKGFGIDCIAEMFERNGCSDFMIEIGGEVRANGVNPSGKIWHIQIDSPDAKLPGENALTVIPLDNAAIATSGNYRNFRTDSLGNKYGHTIDPRTGYPADCPTLSASVIAPSCAVADAFATACMVLPPDTATFLVTSILNTTPILLLPPQ